MRNCILCLVAVGLVLQTACSPLTPVDPPLASRHIADMPGKQPSGAILLPNQWSLRPVGKQIALGDFPANMAVHPTGKWVAVLHCGYGEHQVTIVQIESGKIVSSATIDEAFYGLAFSTDGRILFCSGAGNEVVHTFGFADGYLGAHNTIPLRDAKLRGIPSGLAPTSDGQTLYVANVWGHRITQVDLTARTVVDEILIGTNALVRFDPDKTEESDTDAAAILKRAEAALDATQSTDPFPYTCVLDERLGRLYVSLWAQGTVAVVNLQTKKITARWPADEHPNEMLLSKSGKHLFVANANRNTVTIFDTDAGRSIETLVAELLPNSPPGSTPNSLALSPDESLLFVANANINTVAVFEVSNPGKSRSLGFIPVGWYPTSVRVTPDGKRLLVANGKGMTSRANRHGPRPGNQPPESVLEYIAGLFRGTISVINLPGREKFEERMRDYTAQAYRCMPGRGLALATTNAAGNAGKKLFGAVTTGGLQTSGNATNYLPGASSDEITRMPDNPIPRNTGSGSVIKYCIYIIKENRTYDQVLGDMPEGNGDPSLCLFPERVTPNHHQIARDFVLLDNFYVEGEVSADGHEWTMGAYATDFVEKTWPLSYGHNKHKKFPYPAEGNFLIAKPAGGYLWDRAKEANVTYRSYGEFVSNAKTNTDPGTSRVAALKDHFDPWYRSFDMDYPDVRRAERFISELRRFEAAGDMPRLQVVRLPNDHTSGTTTNKLTPTACVGDNDLAFGMVVEAISHSRFWPQTAIFVVEDDAQNGPDHVDAHRTIAYAISPYIKRGSVDSTMYSTSSMLRTIELILGLKPMSQFDATARPMFNAFQGNPDLRPYKALPVKVNLNERNPTNSWGAELSAKMDFSKEDAADDLVLNEVVWRSVRGPHSPMPPPRHAAFVLSRGKDDD